MRDKENARRYAREWKKRNPEKVLAAKTRYYNAHKEKELERRHRRYQLTRASSLAANVARARKRKGFSKELFEQRLLEQEHRCAVCLIPLCHVGRRRDSACADHNHTTKQPRGILCLACNAALGMLHEDTTVMKALVAYVEKWR